MNVNLEDHDIIPLETLILKKDQIPAPIVKAVNDNFAAAQEFKWEKFPYVLEKYGWIVAKDTAN